MRNFHRTTIRTAPARAGFTLLEFTVAMVVLGIALTGVFPLMVVCSRGVESLELRYTSQGDQKDAWFSPVFRPDVTNSGVSRTNYGTWYVVPSADPWARKLGAVATLSQTIPSDLLPATILDDGDSGFAATGAWTTVSDSLAFEGDYRTHALQDPAADAASWTFSNVASGKYHVLATWRPSTDNATDAAFTIRDGAADASPVTVTVDQTAASDSSVYAGWAVLTTRTFSSADKIVKVTLSCDTEKAVTADAVRIVPAAEVLSVNKSFDEEKVTVVVKIGA